MRAASRLRTALVTTAVTAALGCSRAPATTPYNVLLVSLDSVRQDLLGCYGRRPLHAPGTPTSPTLDRLAHDGVRMLDAYASAPWTLASHMSMMTGQPTMVHAVETFFQALDGSHPLLAEILRAHGYRTSGVFSGPYLEPHWGFGRGFERYQASYGDALVQAAQEADELRTQIAAAKARHDDAELDHLMRQQQGLFHLRVEPLSERDESSDRATENALTELDRLGHGGDPWFLFVHYFDPHYDYVPPAPYDTRFDPDYRGAITGVNFIHNPAIAVTEPDRPDDFHRRVDDRDLEHVVALYEGEMAWTDAHVGTLLARLDALGLARRTLVIVVGDHGDEFFEHGGIGHHRTLYEEAVKVPMILRLPGVLPADRAVSGAVTVADVMPTVLDAVGVPVPPGLGSTSILPLVRGAEDPATRTAMSRLVLLRQGKAVLDADVTIAARQVTVLESFWRGPVKITRRRSWPQFAPDVPPDVRPVLQREVDAEFAAEDLRWTDVARFPTERDAEQSTSFDDPAARAALLAFRARYGELLALHRGTPTQGRPSEQVQHALDALGYVDTSPAEFWGRSPDAVLPLPGAGVVEGNPG